MFHYVYFHSCLCFVMFMLWYVYDLLCYVLLCFCFGMLMFCYAYVSSCFCFVILSFVMLCLYMERNLDSYRGSCLPPCCLAPLFLKTNILDKEYAISQHSRKVIAVLCLCFVMFMLCYVYVLLCLCSVMFMFCYVWTLKTFFWCGGERNKE